MEADAAEIEALAPSQPRFFAHSLLASGAALQAVTGCFRERGVTVAVLGRETHLEMLWLGEDGRLASSGRQPLFGTLVDLAVLPWRSERGGGGETHVRRVASACAAETRK